MRRFTVPTPTRPGIVVLDDVPINLTDDDANDLNEGSSITTLTTTGEEVAVYPS